MRAKTVGAVHTHTHTMQFISQAKEKQNRRTNEKKLAVTISSIVALFCDINFIKIKYINVKNKFIWKNRLVFCV